MISYQDSKLKSVYTYVGGYTSAVFFPEIRWSKMEGYMYLCEEE